VQLLDQQRNVALVSLVDQLQQDFADHDGVVKILERVMDHDHPQSFMIVVESVYPAVEGRVGQYLSLQSGSFEERCVLFIGVVSACQRPLAV